MITTIAIVCFCGLVVLFSILVLLSKIVEFVASIQANVYRERNAIDQLLRDVRDTSSSIGRIETHVRGPAGAYGPPPAATSSIDPTEVEPNP